MKTKKQQEEDNFFWWVIGFVMGMLFTNFLVWLGGIV